MVKHTPARAMTKRPGNRKHPPAADWRKRSERIPMSVYTRPWNCPDCENKVYISYEDLLNHRKDVAAYDVLFQCDDCGAKVMEPITYEDDESSGWERPELACVACNARLTWREVGGARSEESLARMKNPTCANCRAKAGKLVKRKGKR